MSKSDALRKIRKAEADTQATLKYWRFAVASLDGDVGLNGFGVLRDRNELGGRLIEAKAHIERALQAIAEMEWPTDEEYDQAG